MDTFEFHEIVKENISIAKKHNFRLYQDLCSAYAQNDYDAILTISEELSDILAQANKGSSGYGVMVRVD